MTAVIFSHYAIYDCGHVIINIYLHTSICIILIRAILSLPEYDLNILIHIISIHSSLSLPEYDLNTPIYIISIHKYCLYLNAICPYTSIFTDFTYE